MKKEEQVMSIQFDKVARTERYYTSTILPFLLMSNSYKGLYLFFNEIFGENLRNQESDIVELVTELDPLRDSSTVNDAIKAIYKKKKRIAVPDLFLRINSKIIIIEAKFFTFPDKEQIEQQVNLQKHAIECIKRYTIYSNCEIKYVALTIQEQKNATGYIHWITWDKIIEIIESVNNIEECAYYLNVLKSANERAKQENSSKTSLYTWEHVKFNELLDNCNDYIKQGKVFVGFMGGYEELHRMNLKDLENRNHYKISETCISNNWITIDKILSKYIDLKYKKIIFED